MVSRREACGVTGTSLAPEGCARAVGLVGNDRRVPEGHTIHRLARRHARLLVGQHVSADSPQGRFEDGARLLDGRVLERDRRLGQAPLPPLRRPWLHVHLGLYGKFRDGALPAPAAARRAAAAARRRRTTGWSCAARPRARS